MAEAKQENFQLKDWFNEALIDELGTQIQKRYTDFDVEGFTDTIISQLDALAFKERIALIARTLRDYLPDDYPTALGMLLALLDVRDGALSGKAHLWVIDYFVEQYGLDYYDESIKAMYEITQRHTSEFAIRPFLQVYPEQTLAILHEWKHDSSEHVRRLVSEGTRPRLPWGGQLKQFIQDPTPTLALLEALKDDPSEYVRRSVANHLNDITKDHPELVLDTLEAWSKDASKGTQWLIKHALRSQLKAGDRRALALLGYHSPKIALENFTLDKQVVHMGETFTLEFTLRSESDVPQSLMVDYIMHFMKANGKTSPKVFKLKTCELAPNEAITISKAHTIRPITTRVYYAGMQGIEIQVNGQVMGRCEFELEVV